MSRPLITNPKRQSEAAKFHRDCFRAHGRACFFCGKEATDAMHIIPRSQLGPLRYELPVQNSRPGCRACHEKQEAGEIDFPIRVRRIAVRAHNAIARVALPLP